MTNLSRHTQDTALTKAQVADMYREIMGEAKLRERCKSAEFINNPEISICPFLKSDPAPPQTAPSSSTSDTQKVATLKICRKRDTYATFRGSGRSRRLRNH